MKIAVLAAVCVVSMTLQAKASPVGLNLDLQADLNNHTWQVFGTITGDTARTQGLAGFSLDVTGNGGTVVTGSTNDSPRGLFSAPPDSLFITGFQDARSNGNAGIGIQALQPTPNYQHDDTFNADNLLLGVGLVPGNANGATWAYPVLLAHGTFTGNSFGLAVISSPALVTFLPATIPAPTAAGVVVNTFNPDFVLGPTTTIPEPASLGLSALGAVALLTRRCKAG